MRAGGWSFVDAGLNYTGASGLIDPNFNAYSENYIRLCGGVNVTFTGLATCFPPVGNTSTADIRLLADDNVSELSGGRSSVSYC
ncbi:MAG: hypothetical protein ACYDAH_13805 [Steroidobacteraceae bacterium]